MSTISIIVPVYNTELFLPRCLEHLIGQTYTDFEILLINDGSTDNSLPICNSYAEMDNRIKVIHTEHLGVGAVRNIGLDNAKGKYVMFCDSDDYVELNWVEELYKAAEQYPDSLCNCEYALNRPSKGKKELQTLPKITKSQLIPKKYFYPLLHYGRVMQIWTRIYRNDIIKKYDLRFHEDLVEGEDAVFNCDYLNYCNSFYYIHKCLYYWVDNDVKSITRSFHPYFYETLKIIYYARKQHVDREFMQDFYDYSFRTFMMCLDFVWDKENTDTEKMKMEYCQNMFSDPAFQESAKNVSLKECSKEKKMIIRTGNYESYHVLFSSEYIKS